MATSSENFTAFEPAAVRPREDFTVGAGYSLAQLPPFEPEQDWWKALLQPEAKLGLHPGDHAITDLDDDFEPVDATIVSKSIEQRTRHIKATVEAGADSKRLNLDVAGLTRVDVYLDDEPVISLEVGDEDNAMVVLPDAPEDSLLEVWGFEDDELVMSTELPIA